MTTDRNSFSPTGRWNGQADAWGAVRMQSRFLNPANPEPLCEPTNNNICESVLSTPTIPDSCWDCTSNETSVGRGSLLHRQNRGILHKTDRELDKQLRLATGRGYNTDELENSFNNRTNSDDQERFADDAVDPSTDAPTLLPNAADDNFPSDAVGGSCNEDQIVENIKPTEEASADCDSIVWEERTSPPAVPSHLLTKKQRKNVALESLLKRNQKATNVEIPIQTDIVETPTERPVTKVKEDWRAEAREEQETKFRRTTGMEDQQTSDTGSFTMWQQENAGNNWKIYEPQPQQTTPVPNFNRPVVQVPVKVEQNQSMPQTDELLLQGQASSSSHRKKKKNKKFVPLVVYSEPIPRSAQPTIIAPAEYRFQTNGVLPSLRNSDHNATLGTANFHSTFGNLFQNALGNRPSGENSGNFNLNRADFPDL